VQRTHVLSHAAGLVIHRILDAESEGGLGLRRCQWFANSLNEPSKAAATRLGFKQDGLLRNHRVLGPGKAGANGEFCKCLCTLADSYSWTKRGLPGNLYEPRFLAGINHLAGLGEWLERSYRQAHGSTTIVHTLAHAWDRLALRVRGRRDYRR
jgi:hypothetical protein